MEKKMFEEIKEMIGGKKAGVYMMRLNSEFMKANIKNDKQVT